MKNLKLHSAMMLSHLATQRERDCVIAAAIGSFHRFTAGHPGYADQPGSAAFAEMATGRFEFDITENTMKKLILSLSVATFGFAGLALPAMAAEGAKEMDFVKVDADANGKVTAEEALAAGWAWTPEQFAAADRDSDGGLSADEFVTATKA